ncbi:unnamed protein product [Cyclocybe aegerita]|uniref:Glycosyl transferase family 25 domain-containing protein n=1 Tax=Cyclocybe aegerita TaxID=1973307 RepID=A0A8S0X4Z8_CYCAE|nr:unnamed protein product [Cyclocybe aegerita]
MPVKIPCLIARRSVLLLLVAFGFFVLLPFWQNANNNIHQTDTDSSLGLGVADAIYVISLPARHDRRKDMEKIRLSLNLSWTYVDALPSANPLVGIMMQWITLVRNRPPYLTRSDDSPSPDKTSFSWPEDAETMNELDFWNVDPWPSLFGVPISSSLQPLASATQDFTIASNASKLPEHLILTPSRVACWYSHLCVIQKIANSGDSVSIILEDDIDMERDIHAHLRHIWPNLPPDWDIVFLGHCWSNEALHPPLALAEHHYARIHKSVSPKCTHAYAVSRKGARRLLVHLRYPPFAFSRAIDQAIAWLVESGRLKSYSVVPSLVVQRKVSTSDVMVGKGTGSKWKDRLTNGILQDLETSESS